MTVDEQNWDKRWKAAVDTAQADPSAENFERLDRLRREHILALEDDDPARKMMRGFVRAAGSEGISVPDLKDSLEFAGHGQAIPAVSNWLRQDAGVKLLECVPSSHGQAPGPKWRVKQDEPSPPEGCHARERALELLEARGPMGATAVHLARALRDEGYPAPARETITRWLQAAVKDGRAHQVEFGRYVAGPAGEEPCDSALLTPHERDHLLQWLLECRTARGSATLHMYAVTFTHGAGGLRIHLAQPEAGAR